MNDSERKKVVISDYNDDRTDHLLLTDEQINLLAFLVREEWLPGTFGYEIGTDCEWTSI
jgi:hypothetical protein